MNLIEILLLSFSLGINVINLINEIQRTNIEKSILYKKWIVLFFLTAFFIVALDNRFQFRMKLFFDILLWKNYINFRFYMVTPIVIALLAKNYLQLGLLGVLTSITSSILLYKANPSLDNGISYCIFFMLILFVVYIMKERANIFPLILTGCFLFDYINIIYYQSLHFKLNLITNFFSLVNKFYSTVDDILVGLLFKNVLYTFIGISFLYLTIKLIKHPNHFRTMNNWPNITKKQFRASLIGIGIFIFLIAIQFIKYMGS